MKNIQAMLNVRNPETVKLLLLTMNYQLMGLRNGYHLRKSAPVCHKILKHRETVKFSILKKDLIFLKNRVRFLTRCESH